MSSEPLAPTADSATVSAAAAAEKGLLVAVLLIVLFGAGAMLFML